MQKTIDNRKSFKQLKFLDQKVKIVSMSFSVAGKETHAILMRHAARKPEDFGPQGSLTAEGELMAFNTFAGPILNELASMPITELHMEHSPVPRCAQTAEQAIRALSGGLGGTIMHNSGVAPDLVEGSAPDFFVSQELKFLREKHQFEATTGDWLRFWVNQRTPVVRGQLTGEQVAGNLAKWTIKALNFSNYKTIKPYVFGISHGPAMGAFLLKIEAHTNHKLLSEKLKKSDFFIKQLPYMYKIEIIRRESDPETVELVMDNETYPFAYTVLPTIAMASSNDI